MNTHNNDISIFKNRPHGADFDGKVFKRECYRFTSSMKINHKKLEEKLFELLCEKFDIFGIRAVEPTIGNMSNVFENVFVLYVHNADKDKLLKEISRILIKYFL